MENNQESQVIDKKRQKEELQREKLLNRSLVPMSKQTQSDTGIVGVQPDDYVFYLGRWKYIKIYNFQSGEITDRKKESLIKVLSSITKNRIRLTSFRRLKGNSKILYLSVYIMAYGYAEAKSQFEELENSMNEMVGKALSLPFSAVSLNDAVMMTQLNSAGHMKQFDFSMLRRKDSLKTYFFPVIEGSEDGFLHLPEVQKYVYTFMGTQYPTSLEYPYKTVLEMPCSLYSSLDMQVMTDEENEMFNFMLEQKYNHKLPEGDNRNINMTYLVGLIADEGADRNSLKEKMFNDFNDNGVILSHCAGDAEKVYQSICSLGLIDFHAMRNSDADVIYKLVL